MTLGHPTQPEYENPPLVETALGIQFEELEGFRSTHFGQFYETIKHRFPLVEDQPRLAPIHETIPRLHPVLPGIRGMLLGAMPVGRVWFRSGGDTGMLLQLQPDRLGLNWQRTAGNRYLRFVQMKKSCLDEFGALCRFCDQNKIGPVAPNLCEVVYVNHIVPLENEEPMGVFGRMFSGIRWIDTEGRAAVPESATINRTYRIGENQGRGYVEAALGQLPDGSDIVSLKITARIARRHDEIADVGTWLQLGHDWVVSNFERLTDAQIQGERWGKRG